MEKLIDINGLKHFKEKLDGIYNRSLDSRIVALIDPINGDWSDVEMANQVNKGNGATEGDLTCIINENETYIGQGYTNIATGLGYQTDTTYTLMTPTEYKFTKPVKTSGMNLNLYLWKPNTDYFVSMKIKGGLSLFKLGNAAPFTVTKETKDGDYYSILFRTGDVSNNTKYLDLTTVLPREIGEEFHVYEFMVVENTTSDHIFVEKSISNGSLKIDKPYTSANHTIIGVGFEKSVGTNYGAEFYYCGATSTNGEYVQDPTNTAVVVDFMVSSKYHGTIDEHGQAGALTLVKVGETEGYIRLNRRVGQAGDMLSFKYFAVYEGSLTQEEMEREIDLLRTGHFSVPRKVNTSARETIPYAVGANGGIKNNRTYYNSLNDLPLSYPCTMQDVLNVLPRNSTTVVTVGDPANQITDTGGGSYGLLTIHVGESISYKEINFTHNGDRYVGNTNFGNGTWIGWHKITTT